MFFRSLWPALSWALFILIICGIPGENLPQVDFLEWLKPDKMIHLFVFGLLSFLLAKGFIKQEAVVVLKLTPVKWALVVSILYGALIEVMQDFVFIGRSGDVRDAIANALGALLGIWFFNRLMKKRRPENSTV